VRLIASPASMRKPYVISTMISRTYITYWFERSCDIRAGRGVVQGNATIVTSVELIRYLRDALVAAIAGSEVQVCCPVVREVF
jgi:hypothetical protein